MNTIPSTCRNCGTAERYAKEVSAAGPYGPDLLPVGFFVRRRFRIEVCGVCGQVEWFVPQRFLNNVKTRLDRLHP